MLKISEVMTKISQELKAEVSTTNNQKIQYKDKSENAKIVYPTLTNKRHKIN